MNLNQVQPDKFSLTFESQGNTFLFEDVVSKAYWEAESIIFYDGISVKVFSANKVVEQFKEEGKRRTSEQTRKAIDSLNFLVDEALAQTEFYKKKNPLEREDVIHMFSVLEKICGEYVYFDPYYWEGAYGLAENNSDMKENIALVQSFKNEIRAKMDPVFFDVDGYWGTMLNKATEQYGVPVADLNWYTKDEIIRLFGGDGGKVSKVSTEVISSRKRAYLFYQNDARQTFLVEGAEAQAVIKRFIESIMPAEAVSFVRGSIAHGKGKIIRGRVKIITREYSDPSITSRRMSEMNPGDILISETTDPELMDALRKAGAIVTDVGGMLSHAAITARELDIPCIVNTKNATKVFKGGDMVEVNTEQGIVRIIN